MRCGVCAIHAQQPRTWECPASHALYGKHTRLTLPAVLCKKLTMEDLISEVYRRNVLWNRRNIKHKDRTITENEWDAVARIVGITKEDAKKKWRSLRDQFAKEMKKLKKSDSVDNIPLYTGRWQYFTSLLFLKDVMTHRNTSGRSSTPAPGEDDEEPMNESQDPEVIFTDSLNSCKSPSTSRIIKRKKVHKLLNIKAKKLAVKEESEDENSLFLRSLLPFMKKLEPIQQLRVRTKFQNILLEELEAVQSREPGLPSAYAVISLPNSPPYCPSSTVAQDVHKQERI